MMLQKKNDAYFKRLIEEHRPLIMNVCRIFHSDLPSRRDLFQDICINIWKGLDNFEGRSKLSSWIYRIALNTALSQTRKNQKDPLFQAHEIEDMPADVESGDNHKIQAMYAAIKQLKDTEKAVILLYLEDKSYQEIADIIGISIKNVSVRLVRIKRKLYESINNNLIKRGTK